MADAAGAPPLRWLFGTGEQRGAAFRYWIRDSAMGALNLAVHSILRLLPTDRCSAFGAFASKTSRYRYPECEPRARRLWTAFHPDASEPHQIDQAMRRLWRCVGRTMAEYSVLDRFWGEGRIAVEGVEHLQAARDGGRPVLIASVHLGNWETIGPTLVGVGFPGSGFYEPPENRFEHHIAVEVRLRYGAKLVYPTRVGGREAYRLLTERPGEVFLIYVDEMFRGQVSSPAFGRSRAPEGNIAHVARLARMADAAIIPAYCERLDDSAKFKVRFLPAVDLVKSGDRNADLVANIAAIDGVFAPIVKKHVDQWYYALDFEFDGVSAAAKP